MTTVRRRGSILVAVLAMASVLVVFVGVGVERLQVARREFRSVHDDVQADLIASGTVERLFARGGGRFPAFAGVVTFAFDGAFVEATAQAEAGRIDLNFAPIEVLAGLIGEFDVAAGRATALAEAIERRRHPGDADGGASGSTARAGPFEHVDALASVPGFDRALVERLRPYLTVSSFTSRIALLVADPVVVAALPGFDRSRIADFVEARRSVRGSFEAFVRHWGIDLDHVTSSGGEATRLFLTVHVGPHRVQRYEIVVAVRRNDEEPYRIVAWQNERPLGTGAP